MDRTEFVYLHGYQQVHAFPVFGCKKATVNIFWTNLCGHVSSLLCKYMSGISGSKGKMHV